MTDLLFAIGSILTALSYTLTDFFLLRLLLIFASLFFIVGAFVAGYDQAGMKETILASVVYISINTVQLIRLILERVPVFFPNDLKSIYYALFKALKPNEFLKLYKSGAINTIKKGEYLTVQNEPVSGLFAIVDGCVDIIRDKQGIAQLGEGFFIGEMSFLSQEMATATAMANGEVNYIIWSKSALNELKRKDIDLYNKLTNVVALNLIKKLDVQSQKSLIEHLS